MIYSFFAEATALKIAVAVLVAVLLIGVMSLLPDLSDRSAVFLAGAAAPV